MMGCSGGESFNLVFIKGSAAADVAAAFLDLVLLDGGLLETGVAFAARRRHARSRFCASLLTGLAVCCWLVALRGWGAAGASSELVARLLSLLACLLSLLM